MMDKLAIVIPAYKPDYLSGTLESICAQSRKDFRLYVADDASPHDILSVVKQFEDRIAITYHRFENNLGGTDLVKHWERCVDLAEDEEWIWLFSDDDVMEPDCVKAFLEADKSGGDVFRFDLTIIDGTGKVIRSCNDYPRVLSPEEFYRKLYLHEIDARMPEFIFRKSTLSKYGFVDFDLAWRSDNATVMLNSQDHGIHTVSGENARVQWRASQANISSFEALRERKNRATVNFFNWAYDFFRSRGMKSPINTVYHLKTILFEFVYSDRRSFRKEAYEYGKDLKWVNCLTWPLYAALIEYRIFYRRYDT